MRKIWDIPGGIHPPENKQQSLKERVITAPVPAELVFPLNQNLGAPSKPTVQIGEHVLKGQKIADAGGFVGAPIHASSSGTVIAIEDRILPHSSGMLGTCIVIQTDGQDSWCNLDPITDYRQHERSEILGRVRNAGIVGLGGAGFPSAVKLNPPPSREISTLIINGTECEPYITADDVLMREKASDVISGTLLLAWLLNSPENILIGVEDNKPEAIAALVQAASGTPVEIAVFPTKYPSGGEKQLIQILTGMEVPRGGLPADIGIVVQNVGTTVAIHEAITEGKPLISRITTVTGNAVRTPRNYSVRLGTPASTLLALSGYLPQDNQRVVMGGPMMGFTLPDIHVPIIKTTNCLLAPDRSELPLPPPSQACIRCGLCAEACPVSLLPQQMYWYAQSQDLEKLKAHNLADCIECGCCSYVCPSAIPLVQYYRASKAEIRRQQEEKKKADNSKARYEARLARQQRAEAEKEARRQEKKEAAHTATTTINPPSQAETSTDIIAAAVEKVRQDAAMLSPEEQRTRLERALESATNRLKHAQEKLQAAEAENSPQTDQLRARVADMLLKRDEAQQKLSAFQADPTPVEIDPLLTGDAAQAAIDRALSRMQEARSALSDQDRLNNAISNIEKKLATARAQRQAAEGDSDKCAALDAGIQKLEQKLSAAKAEQSALPDSSNMDAH